LSAAGSTSGREPVDISPSDGPVKTGPRYGTKPPAAGAAAPPYYTFQPEPPGPPTQLPPETLAHYSRRRRNRFFGAALLMVAAMMVGLIALLCLYNALYSETYRVDDTTGDLVHVDVGIDWYGLYSGVFGSVASALGFIGGVCASIGRRYILQMTGGIIVIVAIVMDMLMNSSLVDPPFCMVPGLLMAVYAMALMHAGRDPPSWTYPRHLVPALSEGPTDAHQDTPGPPGGDAPQPPPPTAAPDPKGYDRRSG